MTAVTISALPAAPNRATDSPANFATKADAMMTALATFIAQCNAAGVQISSDSAAAAAAAISTALDNAQVAANTALAALYAGAINWVSGTTYAVGDRRISPANGLVYRRITSGAGTTDPSADTTNWAIVQVTPPTIIVSTTTQTAVAGYEYVLTNAAVTTVTLPASPNQGDKLIVKVANGRADNVIDLNGKTFEDDNIGTLILDSKRTCIYVQYLNNSWRLV